MNLLLAFNNTNSRLKQTTTIHQSATGITPYLSRVSIYLLMSFLSTCGDGACRVSIAPVSAPFRPHSTPTTIKIHI